MNRWGRVSWTLRWVARTWPRGTDRRDPVTWIWKAFRERLTPAGKALAGIWLFLLPISVLTHGRFGGVAIAAVSAMLATSWLWTLRSPRAWAKSVLPATMREGETISVRVFLGARGRDLLPDTGAWIFRTGDGLEALGDGAVSTPVSARSGMLEVPLRALRRGHQVVEGPTVSRSDPLGLFRSRSLSAKAASVLVLPRTCRVVSLESLVRGPGGGEFATALDAGARGEENFVGIRPWRDGDNLRALHHRAWARTGSPMVRETERDTGRGIVLVFHSGCGSWSRGSLMDPAISLAAGLARFLSDRGALSGFFLDNAWVPLPGRDPVLVVESALAGIPARGGWTRHRDPPPWKPDIPLQGLVISVAFAGADPAWSGKTSTARRLWIDWDREELPSGVLRVDPEQILSGFVRL